MSFSVRTAQYNTVNLQDLGASLSQFIINPLNQNKSITLTPAQLNSFNNSNPILILPAPASNQYNIITDITSELIFNTGATVYSNIGIGPAYSYVTSTFGNPAGIAVDTNLITSSTSSIGNTIPTGFPNQSITNILGVGIYMTTVNSTQFSNGTSNVKLNINYRTYTYP
jgi:hypothetical protein